MAKFKNIRWSEPIYELKIYLWSEIGLWASPISMANFGPEKCSNEFKCNSGPFLYRIWTKISDRKLNPSYNRTGPKTKSYFQVHVNLLCMEARFQAELLYTMRAVSRSTCRHY